MVTISFSTLAQTRKYREDIRMSKLSGWLMGGAEGGCWVMMVWDCVGTTGATLGIDCLSGTVPITMSTGSFRCVYCASMYICTCTKPTTFVITAMETVLVHIFLSLLSLYVLKTSNGKRESGTYLLFRLDYSRFCITYQKSGTTRNTANNAE